MIRLEEIGKVYTVKINGGDYTATIANDPSQFEYYRSLGLDVFIKSEKETLKEELDRLGVTYHHNSSVKTLKKKLSDSLTEGND